MAIDKINYKECEKIDARKVNAYLELKIDDFNQSVLVLESSWDPTSLDMTPLVHSAETKTTLRLTPTDVPVYLEYDGESGVPQCIYGEDLARIIPMTKLKDVDQTTPIADGYVYMYDGDDKLFKPYDLQTFVDTTNTRLTNLESRMTAAEQAIVAINQAISTIQATLIDHNNRLLIIEEILTKPDGVPANVKVTWGNINEYSDSTNTSAKTSGFYTHNPNTNVTNDLYMA